MYIYDSVNHAFRDSLAHIKARGILTPSSADPTSPGSNFGTKKRFTREIGPFCFTIKDPRDRLVRVRGRIANPIFSVANSLWIADGRNDLKFIGHYNPHGKNFSDDSVTLHGAYGHRMFRDRGFNQIGNMLEKLKHDPHSRRAFAMVLHPVDTCANSRDIPCLVYVQFRLTGENKLDMTAVMRSQSEAMVMPYDLFALTFFHELIAAATELPLGHYHHIAVSYHYYLEEEKVADEILKDLYEPLPKSDPPRMLETNAFYWLSRTMKAEEEIRSGSMSAKDVEELLMPRYWKDLLHVLGIQSWGKSDETLAFVPEYYRAALM